MGVIFDFIIVIGAVFLGVYVSIARPPDKLIVVASCAVIFISAISKVFIEIKERRKRNKEEEEDEKKKQNPVIKVVIPQNSMIYKPLVIPLFLIN